jgi:hypothetical protein
MATQISLNDGAIASAGALAIQTNGTTQAVSISTGQVATLAKDAVIQGVTVGRGAGAVATNTAVGASALAANTSGSNNVAVGYRALSSMTTGNTCVAIGQDALKVSVAGTENTAVGFQSMLSTLTASANSALGLNSLSNNTTGNNNTAIGYAALTANTTASSNTAVGYQAGYTNVTGADCTFIGRQAGYLSTGTRNTFIGAGTGYSTTGTYNTFVGTISAAGGACGEAVTTGTKNTIIGAYTGNQGGLDIRTSSNYIVLSDGDGNPRLYMNGTGLIFSVPTYNNSTAGSANMLIDSNGIFYRATSSLKYKTDVKDAVHGLEKVMQLRPVTYKGKAEADGDKVFGGLIAEEVDAVGLNEFVVYADDGTPDALAYGNMVSLCIKAIQELKAEVDSLKAQINGASA